MFYSSWCLFRFFFTWLGFKMSITGRDIACTCPSSWMTPSLSNNLWSEKKERLLNQESSFEADCNICTKENESIHELRTNSWPIQVNESNPLCIMTSNHLLHPIFHCCISFGNLFDLNVFCTVSWCTEFTRISRFLAFQLVLHDELMRESLFLWIANEDYLSQEMLSFSEKKR